VVGRRDGHLRGRSAAQRRSWRCRRRLRTAGAAIDAVLERTGWGGCRRISCAERAGSHEAAGGIAVAVAAATLAKDTSIDAVLCVGIARGSGYAITFGRWRARSS